MLEIRFVAYLDGTVIQSNYDNHVLYVDYSKWSQLDKQQRRYIVEDANQHYGVHQRWKAEREKKELDDVLDRSTCGCMTTCAACENVALELAKWRDLARRLERVWYESFSYQYFGEDAAPIMAQLIDHLNKTDSTAPVDKARMSVPIADPTIVAAAGKEMLKPKDNELCYVLRGYDGVTDETVYWQEGLGWRPELSTAKLFTRAKALEMANRPRPTLVVTDVVAVNLNASKEQI